MEKIAKCKSLDAIHKKEKMRLGGPHAIELYVEKDAQFHIQIEQLGVRKIAVTANKDVTVSELQLLFSRIERLLMLFDGVFIPLSEIQLSDSDTDSDNVLNSYKEHLLNGRLGYYSSADFCNYSVDKLLEFEMVLTEEFFYKWEHLLEELDVVHQMYLYSLSDSGITVDVKCAFLIELAEPLVEIVKAHTSLFTSVIPGAQGTSLKICLDVLITTYGTDIFKRELSHNYENFLKALVNSRVRIMHIKREQRGVYFNGSESILYILKMSLLYRRILFEILNIEEEKYKDNLLKCVSRLDNWNGVLERFLIKIS